MRAAKLFWEMLDRYNDVISNRDAYLAVCRGTVSKLKIRIRNEATRTLPE